jgi:hypothetical protein
VTHEALIIESLTGALETACNALESAADFAGGDAAELIQSIADQLREILARVIH